MREGKSVDICKGESENLVMTAAENKVEGRDLESSKVLPFLNAMLLLQLV
jgi:hypothetical protein